MYGGVVMAADRSRARRTGGRSRRRLGKGRHPGGVAGAGTDLCGGSVGRRAGIGDNSAHAMRDWAFQRFGFAWTASLMSLVNAHSVRIARRLGAVKEGRSTCAGSPWIGGRTARRWLGWWCNASGVLLSLRDDARPDVECSERLVEFCRSACSGATPRSQQFVCAVAAAVH
jgi:hypothetical protein